MTAVLIRLVRRPSRRGSGRGAVLCLVWLLALTVGACSGSSGAPTTRPAGSSSSPSSSSPSGSGAAARTPLSWSSCSGGQCATLPVPLDWSRPDGAGISLALFRIAARTPRDRVGSLVMNPGGPGASGIDFLRQFAAQLPSTLRDRFDLVAWDPRGTGASTHVECGTHLDYLFDPDTAPTDPAGATALETASARFARACAAGSGDLLAHISTRDSAQDMDRIRVALGEPKLTYLGYSYGTYLGTVYAEMFPDRIRAMVLDGAVDPSVSAAQMAIQQAEGFDHSMQAFFAACASDRSCTFARGDDAQEMYDAYVALRARVKRSPLPATLHGVRRALGPTELDLGVGAALYSGDNAYAILGQALAAAQGGDGAPLLDLFDQYVDRSASGTYSTEWPAFLAISCLDGPSIGDPATTMAVATQAAVAAPLFGASNVGLGMPCAYWPVPPVNAAPASASDSGAPPIVVVGTTGDPATPVAWAKGLASEVTDGRLILVDGTTHTSFPNGTSCLDSTVVNYLVSGVPPAGGRHCGPAPG